MKVGVVLGSGLGAFAETLQDRIETPYSQIPGWPVSTVAGHAGKLVTGHIGRTEVAVLSGRAHLYEGYTAQQVTFGIRHLAFLGVRSVVLTCAAGGINTAYQPGELVLISDHINLLGANPLCIHVSGVHDELAGPRFLDMSEAYSKEAREIAHEAAAEAGLTLQEGVYAAVCGPSYETPAEIRYLRAIGADLVGMSTVPEAIAANHLGMKVLGISYVANMAAGLHPRKLNHEEILEMDAQVRETLTNLLQRLLPRLAAEEF